MKNKGIVIAGSIIAAGAAVYFLTKGDGPPDGTATITGTVNDEFENPISGIIAELNGYTAKTNSSGNFKISGIEPGEYDSLRFVDPQGQYGDVVIYQLEE